MAFSLRGHMQSLSYGKFHIHRTLKALFPRCELPPLLELVLMR